MSASGVSECHLLPACKALPQTANSVQLLRASATRVARGLSSCTRVESRAYGMATVTSLPGSGA